MSKNSVYQSQSVSVGYAELQPSFNVLVRDNSIESVSSTPIDCRNATVIDVETASETGLSSSIVGNLRRPPVSPEPLRLSRLTVGKSCFVERAASARPHAEILRRDRALRG